MLDLATEALTAVTVPVAGPNFLLSTVYLSDNNVEMYNTVLEQAGLEEMLSGRVGDEAEDKEDDIDEE